MFPPLGISREEYDGLSSSEQCNFEISSRMDMDKEENRLSFKQAINKLFEQLNTYAPLMKHYGFHEETEWRIIANNPKEDVISYRPSNSHIIPYLILPILKRYPKILQEIYIGPSPEPYRCKASIQYLLTDRNLRDVKIKISKLPFTSW